MSSPDPTTDTGSCADSGADPHDHTGHDHPRTGADVVQGLLRGLSVVTLVIPVIALITLLAALAAQPRSPLVLLMGVALGALQLVALVVTSTFATRSRQSLVHNPGLVAARSAVEEVLRLAAVLGCLVLWAGDARGPIGLWVGVGAGLVWAGLATAQTIAARRRMSRPSEWSKDAVVSILGSNVGIGRAMVMRVLDVVGVIAFQIGASMLVAIAPVMVLATLVLSVATGMSTLMQQRRAPAERLRSPWGFAPILIGLLLLAMAIAMPLLSISA